MKASVRNYRGFFVIEAGIAKDAKDNAEDAKIL
jgi:hypothetical protein